MLITYEYFARVVALRESEKPFDFDAFNSAFIAGYKALLAGEKLPHSPDCYETFEPSCAPKLVILQVRRTCHSNIASGTYNSPEWLQFFMYEAMQTVRAADNAPLVFVWQPVSAAGAIMRFGPEEYGGNGDLSVKVRALEALDEKIRYKESEKV